MSTRTTVHLDTLNVGYADDVTLARTLLALKADDDRTNCSCATFSDPGGEPVPVVDAAKGLGFIPDKNLSFNEQVHSMVTKASRRLYYLRLLTKQGMSVSDLTQVYLALIRPVLEYGHVLLVGCSKQQELAIERVQRRALRIISLGGRREVPNLPTLRERRELAAVKLLKAMLNACHPLHDLVEGLTSTGRPLRKTGGLRVPMARTSRLQRSFLHQAIRLSNNQ
ncbi:hypothetical protein Bbelb_235320 [Branchiostoma belcheri]|nr:hypothetical protein Bbelb_235320 [Branchiostoma belcheri]